MEDIGHLADALKFGKKTEELIKELYEKLSKSEQLGDEAKEIFSKYVEEAEEFEKFWTDKHRDCCRSDMDMGALEPVSGIEPEDYDIDTETDPNATPQGLIKKAIEAEESISNYYVDIGEKTSYISNREMEKKAQKRKERISELKSLL